MNITERILTIFSWAFIVMNGWNRNAFWVNLSFRSLFQLTAYLLFCWETQKFVTFQPLLESLQSWQKQWMKWRRATPLPQAASVSWTTALMRVQCWESVWVLTTTTECCRAALSDPASAAFKEWWKHQTSLFSFLFSTEGHKKLGSYVSVALKCKTDNREKQLDS